MHDDLRKQITDRLTALRGEWISKNSRYEPALCEAVGFTRRDERHHDAVWHDYTLELKKGKTGVWLNLVRYSEAFLDSGLEGRSNDLTLVFVTDAQAKTITSVIALTTPVIIRRIGLDEPTAKFLVDLNGRVPHQLNAQTNLTIKDLQEMAVFQVGMLDDLLLI